MQGIVSQEKIKPDGEFNPFQAFPRTPQQQGSYVEPIRARPVFGVRRGHRTSTQAGPALPGNAVPGTSLTP